MMRRRARKSLIESLERRLLLSNVAPVAVNDSYTVMEDQPLAIGAGLTSLYFTGDSKIYTGTHTWTASDGSFTGDGSSDYAHIHFQGTGATSDYWDLWFAPPDGQTLTTGTYTNAARFLFQPAGQPGLDVNGDGQSSNTLTGQFTITQYAYDESGNITNFAGTFEQQSDGEAGQLSGTAYFHYVPDGSLSGVLANDSDANNDPLTAILVSPPTHGSVALFPDGTLNYIPDADYFGTDSFTYKANDGQADSNVATVTINVLSVNDAPTFTAGADQTVNEDSGAASVSGWATQISAGPSNESSQTLSFIVTNNTDPALFSVAPAIDSTGKLTFTPAPNAFGTSAITVVLKDNGGTANGGVDTSDPVTFKINVNAVNDAPVAVNDTFSTGLNQTISIAQTSVLTSLTLNSQSGDPVGQGVNKTWTSADGTFVAQLNNDSGVTLYFQGNGTTSTDNWFVDFTAPGPNLIQVGTYANATLYPYQSDSQVGMAIWGNGVSPTSITGQFTVRQIMYDASNNITRFAADFQQYANGSTAGLSGTINYNYLPKAGVLSNDTDAEGNALTASLVSGTSHGSLVFRSDGSFTYTPNNGYAGIDSFTYRANDGTANSNTATVTIGVGIAPPAVTAKTPAPSSTRIALEQRGHRDI